MISSRVLRLMSFATLAASVLLLPRCDGKPENAYVDNTPTSGKLNVYYDAALERHVSNQALTFEVLYPNVELNLFARSGEAAVQALYNDSCEAIVISRQLNGNEKKAFASKDYFPKFTEVAISGVALITNAGTNIDSLSYAQVVNLLSKPYMIRDSSGKDVTVSVLLDKSNSSVVHYLSDSLLKGGKFSPACNSLGSSLESINYVAAHKNTVAFIDFAWISDVDDSIYKANLGRIRFIALSPRNGGRCELPSQSSFKLGTYALARPVYVYRKTGDFTLAKGFESFVAGPKGQLIFLKQGLMPARQSERLIEVNTKPINAE